MVVRLSGGGNLVGGRNLGGFMTLTKRAASSFYVIHF
jgi:hypothetical protein